MEGQLDIIDRDGLSRVGTLKYLGLDIEIPCIASINSDRIQSNIDTPITILAGCPIKKEPKLYSKLNSDKLVIIPGISPLLKYESNAQSNNESLSINSKLRTIDLPGVVKYPLSFSQDGISINDFAPSDIEPDLEESHGMNVQVISDGSEKINSDLGIIYIQNAIDLSRSPKSFAKMITTINLREKPNKLMYLPGSASVNNLAILAYLGVDIFDTIQCVLSARSGLLMTSSGRIHYPVAKSGLCNCPGCEKIFEITQNLENIGGEVKNKKLMSKKNQLFENLYEHNELALLQELSLVKSYIAMGRLRELVEQRLATEPSLSGLIHVLDLLYYDKLEPFFPINRDAPYFACTLDSLNRIEVKRFQKRVIQRYTKPERKSILLFLPCSAKKPYSNSKSHRSFRYAIEDAIKKPENRDQIHKIIVTSPLGLVPSELELVYPAQHYDIPVTDHWYQEELEMLKAMIQNYLKINHYKQIIIHLKSPLDGHIEDFIRISDKKIQIHRTSGGSPTSNESINNLKDKLSEVIRSLDIASKKKMGDRYHDIVTGVAQYQFGPSGVKFTQDCKVRGKYPNLKLFQNSIQLGMLTGGRGLISLTLDGAKKIASEADFEYRITIDDFKPKGSIMAVGVKDANRNIRIGDEVVAYYGDELRAVGSAVMSGPEMLNSNRGVAVKVRHHI